MRYNVPALTDEERFEVIRFNSPFLEHEFEIRYFPREHRIEIESEYTKGLQDSPEEMEEAIPDNIQFSEESYGDVAYEFIEVELDERSGMWLEDETGDKVLQILNPK